MTDYSDDTNALILRIQIAPTASRDKLPYAREAWAELDDAGKADAVAERQACIDAVVELNTGLRKSMAKRWRGVCNRSVEPGDVYGSVNEGYLASLYAFDLRRGFKHTTYATWCMQNAVVKLINQNQDFGQSASITNAQRAVRRACDAYERDHGRRPTVDEIAALADMSRASVEMVLRMPQLIEGDGFDEDDETPALESEPAPETTESRARINRAVQHAERHIGSAWDEVVGTPLFDRVVMEGANEHAD